MSDEIAAQIEDRVTAVLKAAATLSEDRVYSDADFRVDKNKTPYVRVSCPAQRVADTRRTARHVIEIVDNSLIVIVFGAASAATGDIKRYVRNEAAKLRAAIAANRTLKDDAGVPLAYRTLFEDMAVAVDGTGDKARAACRLAFTVRTANLADDPTKSLPQLAAEQA